LACAPAVLGKNRRCSKIKIKKRRNKLKEFEGTSSIVSTVFFILIVCKEFENESRDGHCYKN
jgi:hypothetical protein